MFLSNGEGVVFPGRARTWFHTDTKQFHLDMDAAKNLIPLATYLWRPLWMVTRSFRSPRALCPIVALS